MEMHAVAARAQAVIARVPGQVGTSLLWALRLRRHPYGVEVVGDPHDVFAPGAVRHPLRRLFRWQGSRALRRQCVESACASYVTERTLQARYPAGAPRPATLASTSPTT